MTQVLTTPNPVYKCQTYIVPACHITTAQSHTFTLFSAHNSLFGLVPTQRQCTVTTFLFALVPLLTKQHQRTTSHDNLFVFVPPCPFCVPHSQQQCKSHYNLLALVPPRLQQQCKQHTSSRVLPYKTNNRKPNSFTIRVLRVLIPPRHYPPNSRRLLPRTTTSRCTTNLIFDAFTVVPPPTTQLLPN